MHECCKVRCCPTNNLRVLLNIIVVDSRQEDVEAFQSYYEQDKFGIIDLDLFKYVVNKLIKK